MAPEQFANNAQTTVNQSGFTNVSTTLTVLSAAAFPSLAQFRILVDQELMLVTAGAGTTTWTVTRGIEGTTAAPHSLGAPVLHLMTAGAVSQALARLDQANIFATGDNTFNGNTFIKGGTPWYDVKAFGAKGDGVTDDTAAIQAALTAARTAGGGVVFLPTGTYIVSETTQTVDGTSINVALVIGSNTILLGAGRGSTSIKLKAAGTPASGANMIVNYAYNGTVGHDTHIGFRDFTLDGNGANQTNTSNGIVVRLCQWVGVHSLYITNCYGTSVAGLPTETFGLYLVSGSHAVVSDTHCFNTATVSTATGFTDQTWTDCTYMGCSAGNLKFGHGFNSGYGSSRISYHGCWSYSNGADGFHIEGGATNIRYMSCTAGDTAAANPTGSIAGYPFAVSAALGNVNSGFYVTNADRVQYIGCTANNSTSATQGHGLIVDVTTTRVRIIGGEYRNNRGVGLEFVNASLALVARVTGGPMLDGNTTGTWAIAGTVYTTPGSATAPAVPATGTYIQNPFPFDATVWITGGTTTGVFLATTSAGANGSQVGSVTPAFVKVPAGAFIAINYTVAPTWLWWLD